MERQWTIWSQQIRSRLGSLVEIGEVRHSPGRMSRFRYLQRYALVVLTRGAGHYEDERGLERSLTEGDWVLVFPEVGHCYRPDRPGGWDEIYAIFEGPVFDTWRETGVLQPERPTGRLGDPARWLADFRARVLDEHATPLGRLCAFQELLAVALEGAQATPAPAANEKGNEGDSAAATGTGWFADACRLLAQPGQDAEQTAHELGMNYETFRRAFRARAGTPPHRYHRQQLIHLAARMLDTTGLKSAEIARSLGFCDEAYFSRVFKQVTGRSPREYRRRQESR